VVGGMWEVVCGRWYVGGGEMKNRGKGLGDEGLPAAGACQNHSLNLSCDSRKPTSLGKEFFFLTERRGNVYENKGPLWKKLERSGNVVENKSTYRLKTAMYMKTKELM